MRVLVSGGAGYIGSHTVVQLVEAGHDVVVVDSFANAKPSVVGRLEALTGKHLDVRSFDLTDRDKTEHLFSQESIDAVIHFAGFKAVGESVAQPLEYYENNIGSTFSLVRAMRRHGVAKLVFSSSATVYGADAPVPMGEDLPTSATNPYGWTKVMQEQILRDVAVADPSLADRAAALLQPGRRAPVRHDRRGPVRRPQQPDAVHRAGRRRASRASSRSSAATTRRPTAPACATTSTCEDLAAGHIAALHRLGTTTDAVSTWNLGTGHGTSVLELVAAFERACGHELAYEIVDRRPGDVAASYADPTRAEAELGWRATRTVDDMCVDTWRWQRDNPEGYPADGI